MCPNGKFAHLILFFQSFEKLILDFFCSVNYYPQNVLDAVQALRSFDGKV